MYYVCMCTLMYVLYTSLGDSVASVYRYKSCMLQDLCLYLYITCVVYICIYTYMNMYTYMNTYTYMNIYTYMNTFKCMNIYTSGFIWAISGRVLMVWCGGRCSSGGPKPGPMGGVWGGGGSRWSAYRTPRECPIYGSSEAEGVYLCVHMNI
jgi:hypothetical protein